MRKFYDIFYSLHSSFLAVEKVFVCVLLFSMIFLSFGQVIFRNVFQSGFMWIDELLRIEVLWVTFVGAALATEYKQHIKIDILTNLLQSETAKCYIEIGSHLFAMIVCILLFYASVDYIHLVMEDPSCNFMDGVPDWNFKLVIPYAFCVMAIRCPIHIVKIAQIRKGKSS